jgi:hypothetical protein
MFGTMTEAELLRIRLECAVKRVESAAKEIREVYSLMNPVEVTPWFDVMEHDPVHPGWYDYRFESFKECRMYWNGNQWGYWLPASELWTQWCEDRGDYWRGC